MAGPAASTMQQHQQRHDHGQPARRQELRDVVVDRLQAADQDAAELAAALAAGPGRAQPQQLPAEVGAQRPHQRLGRATGGQLADDAQPAAPEQQDASPVSNSGSTSSSRRPSRKTPATASATAMSWVTSANVGQTPAATATCSHRRARRSWAISRRSGAVADARDPITRAAVSAPSPFTGSGQH